MTNKALIYCRVSDKKQELRGHGLESQEFLCREYAMGLGLEVSKVFTDSYTGGELNRRGIQDLIQFLKDSEDPHTVIMDHIDRMARDNLWYPMLKKAILDTGSRYEFVKMKFDDSPEGEFSEHVMVGMSTYHRKNNARQTKERMRARAMNGYYVTTPPVGYHFKTVRGHGKMVVPEEPYASIMREALEGFASNRLQTVRDFREFLGRRLGKRVSTSRAHDLLRTQLYCGVIDIPKLGVFVEGKHEALIHKETFIEIGEKLSGKGRQHYSKKKHHFPLRGNVHCASCGRALTAARSKGRSKYYSYYNCGFKGCDLYGKTVPQERLEREFEDLLKSASIANEILEQVRKEVEKFHEKALSTSKELKSTIRSKIRKTESKINDLVERLLDCENTTVQKVIEQKIQGLEVEAKSLRSDLSNNQEPAPDVRTAFNEVRTLLSNPLGYWHSDNLETKRIVPKLVFGDSLVYDRNEGFRTTRKTLPFELLGGLDPESGDWRALVDNLRTAYWVDFIEYLLKMQRILMR